MAAMLPAPSGIRSNKLRTPVGIIMAIPNATGIIWNANEMCSAKENDVK